MNRALVTAVLLVASAAAHAQGDVWQRALDPKASDELADAVYDREMRDGDDQVGLASARSVSLRVMREHLQSALTAYHNAAQARPQRAEPYFRTGDVLYSFYLQNCSDAPQFATSASPLRDCSRPDSFDVRMAEQAIAAWEAAEAREPLHPRFSNDLGESLLFTRAILHTRLATKEHLEKAVVDYDRIISRADMSDRTRQSEIWGNVWGNLAETHMMLGHLDDAIEGYLQAWKWSASESTAYGLAVALDRDSREARALDVIVDQGPGSYEAFREKIARGSTFFVPRGEVFYYFALIEQAWGREDASIAYWREFIASGAHPQFQARAKAHLDALIAKRRAAGRPVPPRDPFMELR